jgi:hypothetical protein
VRKNKYYLLLAMISVGLLILACGLGSDTPSEVVSDAPPPVEEPADEEIPETEEVDLGEDQEPTSDDEEPASDEEEPPPEPEQPDEGAGPDSLDLDNPDTYNQPNVDYYRQSLLYTFTGASEDGSQITGTIDSKGVFSSNPSAYSMSFFTGGSASMEPGTVMTFTRIEDIIYIYTQETGCITFSGEGADNPYETMLDTGGILGGNAQRVMPDEVINGVDTYQYKIDATTMDFSDPTSYDMTEIYDGRIYIAKDGEYVVRLWIEGFGKSEMLSGSTIVGDVYYELNFFDFNVPVEITPPADCPSAEELTSDYPMMDDAYEIGILPGLTSYMTGYSFDEVVAFYQAEMESLGWALTQEFVTAPAAMLMFEKDGETVQISISEDNDVVAVGIIEMNE